MSELIQRRDTVRLQRISKALWKAAALMSAIELGVFSAIANGHDTVAAAASAWTPNPPTPNDC